MEKTTAPLPAARTEPAPHPVSKNQPLSKSKRLWVPWLLFFLQFLGVGGYFVYLNVYLRQAGLSGTQIGVLNMSSSIIGVFGALAWGYISDRTGKPRYLIALGAAGSLISVQFIPLVHTFWAYFAISCLGSLLSSSLITLLDGVTLAMLGAKSENYGRFRMAGSIGYILASSTSGFVYDQTGLRLIFPVYGVFMGCFALVALLLPDIPVKIAARAKSQITAMIRQPAWIIFAVCVFLVWVANYASIMYLGVALLSMGASQSLIGISFTSGALVEIPFMAFSGWFIRKLGLTRLIAISIILYVIRYFLLAWMPTPNWAFFINIINGPAYGLFATCIVAYARMLAPPSLNVTAQGLLNSTINLSGVISALLAGVLFDLIGPRGTFFEMAICCLAALTLFITGAVIAKKQANDRDPEPIRINLRRKTYELKASLTLLEALRQLEIDPQAVMAIRRGEMINGDSLLESGDEVRLVTVIAGG